MTGVVNRVSTWLTSRPPTITRPSGWRSSAPEPRREHQRQRAEQRRQRRHQDRPEAQQRRLVDRVDRRHALVALGVEGEVDHHDRVLLDDADQQDDADDGDQAQVGADQLQRQQRADAGRRQRRENRDRVDVALVEHAQHDVHRDDGREDQQQRAVERGAERFGRALEARLDAGRHADARAAPSRSPRPLRRATRPGPRLNDTVTAGNCAGVVDHQARLALDDPGDARQRNLHAGRAAALDAGGAALGGARCVDVDLAERLRPELVARRRFEHHAVLVGLGVDRRDQALAEGVVERVVDGRHADPEAAGGVAIDVDEGLQALVLQIAGDVG